MSDGLTQCGVPYRYGIVGAQGLVLLGPLFFWFDVDYLEVSCSVEYAVVEQMSCVEEFVE